MTYPLGGSFVEMQLMPKPVNSNLSRFQILGRKPVFLIILDSGGSPVLFDGGEIYKQRKTVSKVSVDLVARENFLLESFRPKRELSIWSMSQESCDFLSTSGWGGLDDPCDVDSLRLEVWAPLGVGVRVFSYPQTYLVP